MDVAIIILGTVIVILLTVLLVLFLKKNQNQDKQALLDAISHEMAHQQSELRQELNRTASGDLQNIELSL